MLASIAKTRVFYHLLLSVVFDFTFSSAGRDHKEVGGIAKY